MMSRVYARILSQTEIQSLMNTGVETAADDLQADKLHDVFPNPFRNELIVQQNSAKRIQILDMMGKVRIELFYPYDMPVHINTENLSAGFYIVRILKTNGAIEIFKVIKSDTPL